MLSKKFYLMAALTTFGCAQTPDIEDENNVILPIDASLCYGSTCRFTYTEIDKADAVHFFQPQAKRRRAAQSAKPKVQEARKERTEGAEGQCGRGAEGTCGRGAEGTHLNCMPADISLHGQSTPRGKVSPSTLSRASVMELPSARKTEERRRDGAKEGMC